MNREERVAGIESNFIVLFPDGKEIEAEDADLCAYPHLSALRDAEFGKNSENKQPPSVFAMQKLELAGYPISSDKGHFNLFPKGKLIFDLLKKWADRNAEELGCFQIESPNMFRADDPAISAQADSWGERHYVVSGAKDERFILPFSGDFGLFPIMANAQFSHHQSPIRMYEFSPSFRRERSGELSGLKRLRAFHMPDIHSFCADVQGGWDEYAILYKRYLSMALESEIDFAIAFRVAEDFYYKHRDQILALIKHGGVPVFIEILSEMKHYWAVKSEFNSIDGNSNPCQLCSVQLDVKCSDWYDIQYVGQDGEKHSCVIIHSSVGSIERWMYSILEQALKFEIPSLPLWLAPSQIRLVPVADRHLAKCEEIARRLRDEAIRADIDDRGKGVSAKIKKAGKNWIPFVVVIGDEEMNGNLSVSIRGQKEKVQMSLAELILKINAKLNGKSRKQMSGPNKLSKQPVFYG